MEPDYISKVGVFPIPYIYLFYFFFSFFNMFNVYFFDKYFILTNITIFFFLLQMPPDILRYILVNVVKEDGDVAFFRLSLTCWLFHGVVCEASFRKEAHFAWLDSKLFNSYIFTSTQFFLFYTTHCV